jgi:exopolysaccharide biosynthesis operon protein EpsL
MNLSSYSAMHRCGEKLRPLRQLCRLFPILLATHAGAAWAAEGDTFRPKLQYSYTHTDNLFLLPDNLTPAQMALYAPEGLSDNYQTLGAGIDVDWKQGRQEVLVNTLFSRTWFDTYSDLDYDGHDFLAQWNWVLGNHLKGELGTTYVTSLGSFQNVYGVTNNARTNRNTYFNATYQFHPRWETGLKLNHQSYEYDDASLASSDYTEDDLDAGIYYRGGEVDRTGVEVSANRGNFPNRSAGSGLTTDYDGTAVRLVMDWSVTGKSRLHGRVGYLSQNYNQSGVQNYSGLNGRLAWDWTPTGKTLVNLAAYRELYNTELAGADYEEVGGIRAQAQWQAFSKVAVGGLLSYEKDKYIGTTLDESVRTASLNATYKPWPIGDFTLSLQNQQRDSNNDLRDYQATMLNLSAMLRF